jgi:hypothetical protein
MFVEELGSLTVRDRAGNRLAEFDTVGFYPYRKARICGGLGLFRNIRFSYEGKSGGDNHRVYQIRQGGYVACSDDTVAIGTTVNA